MWKCWSFLQQNVSNDGLAVSFVDRQCDVFLLLQFNCKRSMLKLVLKAQPNMTVLSIISFSFLGVTGSVIVTRRLWESSLILSIYNIKNVIILITNITDIFVHRKPYISRTLFIFFQWFPSRHKLHIAD